MRFYTPSGGGGRLISCRAGPVELEHVVRCADQRPFGADFVDAAQQELAEALRLFDLSEDRLDDGLAPRVDTLARLAHQFAFFIRSTSVADFGMRPRGLLGTGWLCFCLPVATYKSTFFFAALRRFSSEQ